MTNKQKLNTLAIKLTLKYYAVAGMLWLGSAFTWGVPWVAISLWALGFGFYVYAIGYGRAIKSVGSLIELLEKDYEQED